MKAALKAQKAATAAAAANVDLAELARREAALEQRTEETWLTLEKDDRDERRKRAAGYLQMQSPVRWSLMPPKERGAEASQQAKKELKEQLREGLSKEANQ